MDDTLKRISLIIGTAGHIDHGKTSLIKALTSIDTDRLKEEKKRGLTIELGFAYIDFKVRGVDYRAAIVDVPGHERFIRNMLAGATGMDLVLFTVAADDGIMPQTVEHFDIIRLLGIKDIFFVITKCDLVEEKAISVVEEKIKDFIRGTPIEGAPLFRVSVLAGTGIAALSDAIAKKVLSMKERGTRQEDGAERYFRMPVDRSFTIKGFGTVVTGTVAQGSIKKSDTVLAYPSGRRGKVRGLESMHLHVAQITSGDRAAINISGLSKAEIKRGHCLMAGELAPFITMSPVVDCSFEFIGRNDFEAKKTPLIRDRALIKVFHHTGEALARIRFFNNKDAAPGARAVGRLFLKKNLPMMRGDAFILRDSSLNTTVGGGRVIFSYPVKELVPRVNRLAPYGASEKVDVGKALAMLLGPARPGIAIKTLSLLLNVTEDNIPLFLHDEGLFNGDDFYLKAGYLLHRSEAHTVKNFIKNLLENFHKTHPLEDGLSAEDLGALYANGRNESFAAALKPLYIVLANELDDGDDIELKGTRLCLKGHSPGLSGRESVIESRIKELLQGRGLSLTKKEEFYGFTQDKKELDAVISYMKKNGNIISLKAGVFISPDALAAAGKKCFEFIRANKGITAAQCRDILGCGRKLAIIILEYFDSQGQTIRRGDIRTLR